MISKIPKKWAKLKKYGRKLITASILFLISASIWDTLQDKKSKEACACDDRSDSFKKNADDIYHTLISDVRDLNFSNQEVDHMSIEEKYGLLTKFASALNTIENLSMYWYEDSRIDSLNQYLHWWSMISEVKSMGKLYELGSSLEQLQGWEHQDSMKQYNILQMTNYTDLNSINLDIDTHLNDVWWFQNYIDVAKKEWKKISDIFQFCKDSITYQNDLEASWWTLLDHVYRPEYFYDLRTWDCDDYSLFSSYVFSKIWYKNIAIVSLDRLYWGGHSLIAVDEDYLDIELPDNYLSFENRWINYIIITPQTWAIYTPDHMTRKMYCKMADVITQDSRFKINLCN